MSADTLTADGAATTIPAPGPDQHGYPSHVVGYVAVPGHDEIVVVSASSYPNSSVDNTITATGYSSTGQQLFQTSILDTYQNSMNAPSAPVVAALINGNVVVAWNDEDGTSAAGHYFNAYQVISPSGADLTYGVVGSTGGQYYAIQGDPALFATSSGFDMAWNAESTNGTPPAYQIQGFDMSGIALGEGSSTTESSFSFNPPNVGAHAAAGNGSVAVQTSDNILWFMNGNAVVGGATFPGEPAHAITDEAAALLSSTTAAVAWVDSGTDYVAMYNLQTNGFGPTVGLDWGGASDLHMVTLPDGGFAVSWMNGGAYKGELFDAQGNGGGVISLAGDVAGITSSGELYTVAPGSNGTEIVQTYVINGSGGSSSGGGTGGGSGSTVYTSDASYTAPNGVTTIYLTGSNQTITANNEGDTIWSDNTQNTLTGGTGADTFHIGRAGDHVISGGGTDTFDFAEIPWAAGYIRGFAGGDVLDLTGLMSTTSDTGADGFADGYLKMTDGAHGSGVQVWAQYDTSGSGSGWWLVTTLQGVTTSELQTSGDTVTMGSSSVTTADANYVAPANVTSITLTGSQQHIDASATHGVTITSNDTGNTLIGGSGADLFHLGRGGDNVTGGGGADIFSFDQVPWAGGHIRDFTASQGDEIDVSHLLASAGYTGTDPIADGYLKITAYYGGDTTPAQIWANYHQAGNDGWWLVTTVDLVHPSSLHYANGMIT